MRIILDTNVLVSALIQRNYPHFVVDSILVDKNLCLCISDNLFTEYLNVLGREKFSRFPDFYARAQTLLADIESLSLKFKPTQIVDIIRDKADNRLLELAETCGADYLITGNTSDFTMIDYKGTRIISPKDFFELLNK